MRQYVYTPKALSNEFDSKTLINNHKFKPCHFFLVNRNKKSHNFLEACLYSQRLRSKKSFLLQIDFERRIDFRIGWYVYTP